MGRACGIWVGHVEYGQDMWNMGRACGIWVGHVEYG